MDKIERVISKLLELGFVKSEDGSYRKELTVNGGVFEVRLLNLESSTKKLSIEVKDLEVSNLSPVDILKSKLEIPGMIISQVRL